MGAWTGGGGCAGVGNFNIAVVQAVIIYRLETWVMYIHNGRAMGGFHHRMVRILTGRILHQNLEGMWMYPYLEEEMLEVGVQEG